MAFAAFGIRFFKPSSWCRVLVACMNFVIALSEFQRTGLVLAAFVVWFAVDRRERADQKRHEELMKAIADRKRDLSNGRAHLDAASLDRIVGDLQGQFLPAPRPPTLPWGKLNARLGLYELSRT